MVQFHPFTSNQARIFHDRKDAGKQLAEKLKKYIGEDSIILSLPRGGVVVAKEAAESLQIPMEVIVARKIGAPHNPELAIGAIAEGDVVMLDEPTIEYFQISKKEVEEVKEKEKKELKRRVQLYRHSRSIPSLNNKTVILIDDGLATGATAIAAIQSILRQRPFRLVLAVPVCSKEMSGILREYVDDLICLSEPFYLGAISQYYHDFRQVTDEEVLNILAKIKRTSRQKMVH